MAKAILIIKRSLSTTYTLRPVPVFADFALYLVESRIAAKRRGEAG
jgi:hypothetical protein